MNGTSEEAVAFATPYKRRPKLRDRKPMQQKTHLTSKAINSETVWILKNKLINFLLPISYYWKTPISLYLSRAIMLIQLA